MTARLHDTRQEEGWGEWVKGRVGEWENAGFSMLPIF